MPGVVCSVPAAHVAIVTHCDSFAVVVCLPLAHAEQSRSAAALPTVLTYVPAAQVFQLPHVAEFTAVLNVWAAHEVHVRLVVAEPEATTFCPSIQSTWATQAVAEFPSWSHVPLAQACLMAFVLSLGDLAAVTLLGSEGIMTLPSLVRAQMGHYRGQDAQGT